MPYMIVERYGEQASTYYALRGQKIPNGFSTIEELAINLSHLHKLQKDWLDIDRKRHGAAAYGAVFIEHTPSYVDYPTKDPKRRPLTNEEWKRVNMRLPAGLHR